MYLSQKIIKEAYKQIGEITDKTGKKPIEVTSAIRYLLAISALLKSHNIQKISLDVDNDDARREFVEQVGRVVSLSDNIHYTNNFLSEFLTSPDYAARNNFLTTRLKSDGLYPGRPAPLISIENQTVGIIDDVEETLKNSYNLETVKVGLVLWILRNEDFKITDSDEIEEIVKKFNQKIADIYEAKVADSLKISSDKFDNFLKSNSIEATEIFNEEVANTTFLLYQKTKSTEPKTKTQAENKIFFGCPGSGKSFAVNEKTHGQKRFTTTFHPEYDYGDFVGAYKPTKIGQDITYAFVPQIFVKAYVEAWKNSDESVFFVIEEINRGNCAAIFGDIFQLLDRDANGFSEYATSISTDLAAYLETELTNSDYATRIKDLVFAKQGTECSKPFEVMILPDNLSIFATMNTSDQSLFPMDSAFKRRWEWEYVPIDYEDAKQFIIEIDVETYGWSDFLQAVNEKIYKITESEDKQLGNRFVNPSDQIIKKEQFLSKVMFYLWFDVFKNEDPLDDYNIFKVSENEAFKYSDLFEDETILPNFLAFNGINSLP
ncbi:MAG: McrB family protein [Aridibacter sp.]